MKKGQRSPAHHIGGGTRHGGCRSLSARSFVHITCPISISPCRRPASQAPVAAMSALSYFRVSVRPLCRQSECALLADNILFQCPRCKNILCVSDKAIGISLPCTGCNTPVVVYEPSVRFNCIKCNRELSAFGTIKGKNAQCPNCQTLIGVPLQ